MSCFVTRNHDGNATNACATYRSGHCCAQLQLEGSRSQVVGFAVVMFLVASLPSICVVLYSQRVSY